VFFITNLCFFFKREYNVLLAINIAILIMLEVPDASKF